MIKKKGEEIVEDFVFDLELTQNALLLIYNAITFVLSHKKEYEHEVPNTKKGWEDHVESFREDLQTLIERGARIKTTSRIIN